MIASMLCLLSVTTAAPEAPPVFKAGFATRDITPKGNMPMWGYAIFNRPENMSTGADAPLHAKALVFEAGKDKVAVVGMDTGRAPNEPSVDRIREAVKQRAGVDHVLLGGSHTHHGPALELVKIPGKDQSHLEAAWTYYARLEEDLAGVIVEAAENAVPAKWGWAVGKTKVNRNRHTDEEPIPIDDELIVLRVEDLEGKPIAITVSFAGHPTNRIPKLNKFHPDFPGIMMDMVQKERQTNCMFLQGAAGDMQCDMNDAEWEKVNWDGKIAVRLAAEVLELEARVKTHVPENPAIAGTRNTFDFPLRVDLADEKLLKQLKFAFEEEFAASYSAKYAGNRMHPRLNTVLLNGELALVGASGEFFSGLANTLKRAIDKPEIIFVGYCNGHDLYFPTERAFEQGGYGANHASAWVSPGCPEKMIEKAIENVRAMAQAAKD